jgi:hypothetical protein
MYSYIKGNDTGTGIYSMSRPSFINHNEATENIEKSLPADSVVITNIIELSKEDFNEFTR